MNDQSSFERIVTDSVTSIGVPAPSEDAIERTISRASRTRQRPAWLALIKEPPMRLSSGLAVGSPTARIAAILGATILLMAALLGVGSAGARLLASDDAIVVDQSGGGDFRTIAEAVAAAADGDAISVKPGTYTEAITIDKDITLTGDGPREDIVIMAPEKAPMVVSGKVGHEFETYAILLQESEATVSDLTVRGEPSVVIARGGAPTLEGLLIDSTGIPTTHAYEGSDGTSLVIDDGSAAVIRDNELVGGGPIAVYDGSAPLIEANRLSGGPHIVGIFGDAAVVRANIINGLSTEYPGIWIYGPSEMEMVVEDNTITDVRGDGIWVDVGTPTLRNNTITGARTGIATTSPAIVRGNTIEDVVNWGVSIAFGDSDVEGNTITGAGTAGINVTWGPSTITGNVLRDNAAAIAWDGPGGVIADNEVSGGVRGILLAGGSPTVTGNDIEEVEGRGLFVGARSSPTLSANTSCGNGQNLVVEEGATPIIDETNEICEDGPAQ